MREIARRPSCGPWLRMMVPVKAMAAVQAVMAPSEASMVW
jgi:hypothetical protein